MKKIALIALVIIILSTFFIPITYQKNENGIIATNLDKTMIFFIPFETRSLDICSQNFNDIKIKGIQFESTNENYEQIFRPKCHIISSTPGIDYGIGARDWYLGKCKAEYSYNESVFEKLKQMLNYQQFSIESKNFHLEFQYLERLNLNYIKIREVM